MLAVSLLDHHEVGIKRSRTVMVQPWAREVETRHDSIVIDILSYLPPECDVFQLRQRTH